MASPYRGNQITAVNIGVNCEATNVSIYIKHSPKDDDYIYRQRLDKLEAGWNTIILDTPYEIGEQEDIAIGYKATFTSANGVGYSKDSYPDGDYVYVNSKSQWSSTNGSICIQAYVEGDNMPVDELMMGKINDYIVADYDAETIEYTGSVRNMGVNDVNTYSITCNIDGMDITEYEYSTVIKPNEETKFVLSVPATDIGKHSVTLAINKVNGSDDTYAPNNITTSTYIVRDQEFRRKVVCEEGTGTWCGWCPRGIVGMEHMKARYPGYFVPISIHGGDKLEIPEEYEYNYKKILDSFLGFPTCTVDRRVQGDPYSDIQHMYDVESSKDSPIKIRLSAEWDDSNENLLLTATLTSKNDIKNACYNVAFVVLEDSVSGYVQSNYYAGGKNGAMDGWEDKTDPTIDFVYNDLARGIFPTADGTPIVSDTDMASMTPVSLSYTLPAPPSIADKNNVHIVGIAINANTGDIDNADATRPTGLNGIMTPTADGKIKISVTADGTCISTGKDACVCDIYTLTGIKVISECLHSGINHVRLPKGMYIISVNDGMQTHTQKITLR